MWVTTDNGMVNLDRYDDIRVERIKEMDPEDDDTWIVVAVRHHDNGVCLKTVLLAGVPEDYAKAVVDNLRRVVGSISCKLSGGLTDGADN